MAACGLCNTVWRVAFALFFIAHGYHVLSQPEQYRAVLRAQYVRFEAHIKVWCGHLLPGFLSSTVVAKHAEELMMGYGWALMAAAVVSVLYGGFGVLAASLYFLEATIAQDFLGLAAKPALARAQPVAEAVALVAGSVALAARVAQRCAATAKKTR